MVTLLWPDVMIRKLMGKIIRPKRSAPKRNMSKEAKKIISEAAKNKEIKQLDLNKLKDMSKKEKALNKEKKAQYLLKKGSFKKVRKELPAAVNDNTIKKNKLRVVSSSKPKTKIIKKPIKNVKKRDYLPVKQGITERDVIGQMKRGVSPTTARKKANERAGKRAAIDTPLILNKTPKEAEYILIQQLLQKNKNMSQAEARKRAKARLKRGVEEREIAASFKKGFQDVSDKELKDEASKKSGGKVYKRKHGGKVVSGNDGNSIVAGCYD